MDANVWASRIEQAHDNPGQLERLREDLAADTSLPGDDRAALDGRIGTYLADGDRASEPEAGWDPEAAPPGED